MLDPTEIQGMARRKYPAYLKSLVTEKSIFPLRIRFGVPSTTDEFAKLQREVTALAAGNFGYTIEWEEKNTRKWGLQKLPAQVRFDDEEQFIAALGKCAEAEFFRRNLNLTLTRLPQLQPWIASHVKWVVEFGADWEGMLLVCEYFLANPRPGLYTRELPIQIHTKFIEDNAQVLSSMLSELLPEDTKSDGSTFEERFGLKSCEPLIRFRVLDPALLSKLGLSHEEMGLPLLSFAKLPVSCVRAFITENLMNFECLPAIRNGLAIFGHGSAAELLTSIAWLADCEVHYWGDIDEHGFHILSRLRGRFPAIKSVLMDARTFRTFRNLAGNGEPAGKLPVNLTPEESEAFKEVALHGLRIEQEKLPHSCFSEILNQILTVQQGQ